MTLEIGSSNQGYTRMAFELNGGQKVRLLVETETGEDDFVCVSDRVKRIQIESTGKTNQNLDQNYLKDLQGKFDKLSQGSNKRRPFTVAKLERLIQQEIFSTNN